MAKEKHFVLGDEEFYINNSRYVYSEVVETEFYFVITQKKSYFIINAGVDYNVDIKIFTTKQSQPIKIVAGPQYLTWMFFSLGKKDSEKLIEKFNELSKKTFSTRLCKYTSSLSKNGYFMYDGKKFYETGEVVSSKWKANLKMDKPWYREPFQIFFEVQPSGFLRRRIRYEIVTKRDTDVFFSLLKTLYGISWR